MTQLNPTTPDQGRATTDRLARWTVRHRWGLFGLCAVLIIGLCAGLGRLTFDNGYRSFIGEQNSYLKNSDWLSERRGATLESVVVVYEPGDGNIFANRNFFNYMSVAQSVRDLPTVVRTSSLLDQPKILRFQDDQGDWVRKAGEFLVSENPFDEEGQARLGIIADKLPTISRRYVAADLSSAAITLEIEFSPDSPRLDQIDALINGVAELDQRIAEDPSGGRVFVAGETLFDHAASTTVRKDLRRIMPAAAILSFLLLLILYRSVFFAFISLVLVWVPMIGTAGAAGWLGLPFSNLALSGLLLTGTLAVADVLHVSNSYFSGIWSGAERGPALTTALRKNMFPVLATTVTTVLGQFALLLSPAEPIRVMAWLVIIGSWLALITAYLMLPAILYGLRGRKIGMANSLQNRLASLTQASLDKPRIWLAGALVICLTCGAVLSRTTISDSLGGWFADDTDFSQGLSHLDQAYSGSTSITVALEAKSADSLAGRLHPEVTDEGQRFIAMQDSLSEQFPGRWLSVVIMSRAVSALLDDHPDIINLTDADLAADPGLRNLPPFSEESIADSGLMTPYKPGRTDYALWRYEGTEESSFAALRQARAVSQSIEAASEGRDVRVSGVGIAIADLSVANFWGLLQGSIISFLTVTAVMMLTFRSAGLGLLSILPNGAPILLSFGIWAALQGHLNLASLTVYGVVLGIIVDDTIHITAHFRSALKDDPSDPKAAAVASIRTCGMGVTATTLIIGLGFALLGTSDFLLTAHRSIMASIAVFSALLFDLTILPILLVAWAKRFKARRDPAPQAVQARP